MAQVHIYAVVGKNDTYTSEGTTHVDALNKLVVNPVISYGFHPGSVRADAGDEFIVIGPGEDGPMTIVKLVTKLSSRVIFKTPDQISHENDVYTRIAEGVSAMKVANVKRVELKVTENPRTPPYDLTDDTKNVSYDSNFGVRIAGHWVPWAYAQELVRAA